MAKVVALLLVFLGVFAVSISGSEDENAVMLDFQRRLENPKKVGWIGGEPCTWSNIQCRGGSVYSIQLAGLGVDGTLPPNLNQLASLKSLGLQRNNFRGALPSLRGLHYLETAFFDKNGFDTIPADFFTDLPSLVELSLDHNLLNSTFGWELPLDLAGSTVLANLSLANVRLTGGIPAFLGSMKHLELLRLSYNRLGGGIPESFRKSNIRIFRANNQLGPCLTGPIDALAGMSSLSLLWLHVNAISGSIPAGLADAPSLSELRLNNNRLVGPVPPGFARIPRTNVTLQNNLLNGPIPDIKVPPDGVFDYSNNNFCQNMPRLPCSPQVSALLHFLGDVLYPDRIAQSWSGNDPCSGPWFGISCTLENRVSVINIANSNLHGSISPFLSNLSSLSVIKLNNNNLTGVIPESLTTLKLLETLDLRDNQLSGPIPYFSSNVKLLISGNPLISDSPASTPPPSPSSISPITYTTPPISTSPDPGLNPATSPPPTIDSSDSLGLISPSNEPFTKMPNEKTSAFTLAGIIAPLLGVVAFLIAAFIAFFLVCKRRKKRFFCVQTPSTVEIYPQEDDYSNHELPKSSSSSMIVDNALPNHARNRSNSGPSEARVVEAGNLVISIKVLRDATDNFSHDNILGKGGFGVVYKGELDDGTKIAVKRMESTMITNKGLNEFQAEIEVLTKVRHRNLVALLGYCIDGNERLLVYEYMNLGSLSSHLFDWARLGLKALDWKQRLLIALDVARGMEYLHSLAHKSFIHRDLKSSNILLGDDYRAKVSDFGLVKPAPDGKHSLETRLAGTFGYLAPEYAATGRVTTKSDVFSFGVVLMELITGRAALDGSQPEERMHLLSWFRRGSESKDRLKGLVDEGVDAMLESVCKVAEVAGLCTAQDPLKRPEMGQVVNMLAPHVEQWKQRDPYSNELVGIDLDMTLPQALIKWQAFDNSDTSSSLPTKPAGFAESFTSSDGR